MTSNRWSEPLTQTEPKGETQMELSACIVLDCIIVATLAVPVIMKRRKRNKVVQEAA